MKKKNVNIYIKISFILSLLFGVGPFSVVTLIYPFALKQEWLFVIAIQSVYILSVLLPFIIGLKKHKLEGTLPKAKILIISTIICVLLEFVCVFGYIVGGFTTAQ